MARKSLSSRFPIPNTKEELIKYLRGKNPARNKSLPYWDDEYGKCYFRPRIAGKETTQYFVSLLGIKTKEDCEKIKNEIKNEKKMIDKKNSWKETIQTLKRKGYNVKEICRFCIISPFSEEEIKNIINKNE